MKIRYGITSLLTLTLIIAVVFAYLSYRQRREAQINAAIPLIAQFEQLNNDNPASVIRAINALHELGKDGALECLKRYDEQSLWTLVSENSRTHQRYPPENVKTCVQLLFPRQNEKEKIPVYSGEWQYELVLEEWNPGIEVVSGIPFSTNVQLIRRGCFAYSRSYAIQWARDHGAIRDSKLVPADNPFSVAESMIPRLTKTKLETYRNQKEILQKIPSLTTDRIQQQVFAMIRPLLPEFEPPPKNGYGFPAWSQYPERWEELKERCKQKGLKWSITDSSYVFTNNGDEQD